jgi:tetratricopeptide (TPR) repeat protein
MKSAEPRCVSRFFAGNVVLVMTLAGLIPVIPAFSRQLNAPVGLDRTKSKAATQHEIVMLLIQKGEYERALAEANKIFDMRWPDDQEPLLLRELKYVTDQFLKHRQAPLGLELINRNSKCFKTPSSQIEILKEKGYLYKTLNQNDKALEYFEKARKLEEKQKD